MIYDKANKVYSQTIKHIINQDDVDGEFYSFHDILNITVDL